MGQASQQVELAVPPASSPLRFSGPISFPHGPSFLHGDVGWMQPPQRIGAAVRPPRGLQQPPPPACTTCPPLGPAPTPGGPRPQLGATDCTTGHSLGWAPWGEAKGGDTPLLHPGHLHSPLPRLPAQLRRNRCDTVSLIWLFFLFQTRLTRVASHSGWWQVAWVHHGGTRGLAHGWVERGDNLRRTWLSSGKDGEGLRAPLPSTR